MNRKRLLAVALVVFVVAMISGVAAWLSDDETQTDEMTPTELSIVLNEANWRPENASNVHPEDMIPQNPTVSNTGTASAYVFVEVRMAALRPGAYVANDTTLFELQAPTPLYLTRCRGAAHDPDWQELIGPVYDTASNAVTSVYAYGRQDRMTPLAPGATTPAVFDAIQLQNVLRRDDVQGLDANVYVHAYAIQASDLGNNGASTAPGAVWNIVRNTYKLTLPNQNLPTASPKVLAVRNTPTPPPSPSPSPSAGTSASAKPSPTATPEDDDWVVEELKDDEEMKKLFRGGAEANANATGKRSVG